MKIVIASDSYKGCLSSSEVAAAATRAIKEIHPDAEVVSVPMADGGEGTVEAVVENLGGRIEHVTVSDPLGRSAEAFYGVSGDLAIIECAAAVGLPMMSVEELNPLVANTKGMGELLVAAFSAGCRRFFIGLGGSGTNDGGMGMLLADGFKELSDIARQKGIEVTVACDVDTPFVGPDGATYVFGPQKGATAETLPILEARMEEAAARILADTGVDVRNMRGAGAAGGLGGALCAYLGAKLERGVDMVLDIIDFDRKIQGADLIITGEGRSDFQTLKGKTACGVLERARRQGIATALVSGAIKDEEVLREGGFSLIGRVTPEGMPLATAMRPEVASLNVYNAIKRLLSE